MAGEGPESGSRGDGRRGATPANGPTSAAVEWPLLDRQTLLDVGWFAAGFDLVRRPDGERARHYWVEPADSVAIVAIVDGGDAGDAGTENEHGDEPDAEGGREVVLVSEYRPRLEARGLSCPAGGVGDDEDPIDAAARELREETGYRAGDLTPLGSYRPSGWDRMTRTVVVAEDLAGGADDPDEGEFLEVVRVPAGEVLAAVRAGDGPTLGWGLTPLLWAAREGYLPATDTTV